MQLRVLGSGGNTPVPMPTCSCRVCEQARKEGVPYALEDEDLDESALPADIDLAVFECGLFDEGPDGERLLTETDWTVLDDELRHGEVLDRIDRVDPDRVLLTEIEHLTGRSHDHFRELEAQPEYDGIRFAHDGLHLDVACDGAR